MHCMITAYEVDKLPVGWSLSDYILLLVSAKQQALENGSYVKPVYSNSFDPWL